MQADVYAQKRSIFGGFAATVNFTTAATTADMAIPALKSVLNRLFVQRLRLIVLTGNAGKTVSFASSGGAAATVLTGALALDTASTKYDFDYGPAGRPMTVNELVKATINAAGAAFVVDIEGYQKP